MSRMHARRVRGVGPIAAALFCALPAAPSTAGTNEDSVLPVADPQIVMDIAKGFGSATLDKDDDGDPMIKGRIDGIKYAVFFYGCKAAKECDSLQFASSFPNSLSNARINEWNKTYRRVRVFRDGDTVEFRMDVDVVGSTRAGLEAQFENWQSMLDPVRDFLKK